MRHAVAAFAAMLLAAADCLGQSLEAARQQLRENLKEIHFAQAMLSLVLMSDELELSGASYSFDDDANTQLSVMALPFHTELLPFGKDAPRLWLEGTFGYAEARQHLDDLYGGTQPGNETFVGSRWRTYGALAGLGLDFPVANDLTFAPILDVGLAHIENDTRYGGPGAAATAALADGIAFNWDALAATYGTAARLRFAHRLGEHHRLELVGRYDVRWTETIAEDDPAQDFVARSQLVTLHGDLFGPTGLTRLEQPVEWQLSAAWRAFPEGDLFGVDHYVQLGAGLHVPTGDELPIGSGFAITAAIMLGEDLFGWTVGGRLLF